MSRLPSRTEVRIHLVRLLEGQETLEGASDWAVEQVAEYERTHDVEDQEWDEGVWSILNHLDGVDMKISDTEYLHGPNNFRAWLDELDRSDPSGTGHSG
jgi:hypothetical protein